MRFFRFIQTIITVVPILTAGLYLLGLCTHIGYLYEFGLDYSSFPVSNDIALFTGLISAMTLSVHGALYALLATGAYFALVIVVVVLASNHRAKSVGQRIATWIRTKRPEPIDSPVAEKLIDQGGVVYMYVCGFILAALLLFLLCWFSNKSGREQAQKQRIDFEAGKTGVYRVTSKQAPLSYAGTLIACGDQYCAFWSKAGALLLKHEVIDRIEVQPSATKVDTAN